MSTLHQTIEQIKERAETFTLTHNDVPALCRALEIAAEELTYLAGRGFVGCQKALAQIEAALK